MRKMASIQIIDNISPIDGADKIEVAQVGGWKVVVKKGEFEEGDAVIFCEIDSWIPHSLAPFLTPKGQEPKEFEGVLGDRLRTVRLRKQISQGLVLPLCETLEAKDFGPQDILQLRVGDDLSSILGITKWERPVPTHLAGQVEGSFPSFIPKTDQNRIQNIVKEIEEVKATGEAFEITEKLNGASMTIFCHEGEFGVCSRNLQLKIEGNENNAFVKTALSLNLDLEALEGFALQGELVGEGVQGNPYNLKGLHFYVYNLYNINQGEYSSPLSARAITTILGLEYVPLLSGGSSIPSCTLEDLLKGAEGDSALCGGVEREGVVYKSNIRDFSFKVISNKFLLKGGD